MKPYLWDKAKTTMETDTVKRFDRIVAILIQLQSKKVVRAQELADRFQVSLRTIYRDIRTLENSGVPIMGEAGVGYSIMEGYRLPPVMFTREEASSFVAAEKLMQKFTDRSLGAYYESAMIKLKSVLRNREKEWVEALEDQVSILPAQLLFNEEIPNALEILLESIAAKKQVRLRYESLQADRPLDRCIEPVGLFHENNFWYVLGFCQLRNDYRQFRTDRIMAIFRTLDDFGRVHPPLDELRQKKEDGDRTKVRILVDPYAAKYLKGSRRYHGFISEAHVDGQVELTFMVADLENGFARWFLMFADCAQILEPQSLIDRVGKLLLKGQERLYDPSVPRSQNQGI